MYICIIHIYYIYRLRQRRAIVAAGGGNARSRRVCSSCRAIHSRKQLLSKHQPGGQLQGRAVDSASIKALLRLYSGPIFMDLIRLYSGSIQALLRPNSVSIKEERFILNTALVGLRARV